MAWGDSWGSGPRGYHKMLARAFFEGRILGGLSRDTRIDRFGFYMRYVYDDREIARYTPPNLLAEAIAYKLTEGVQPEIYSEMAFRIFYGNKAEMRHLKALGVEAEWQYGGLPFLAFGVDVSGGHGWKTIEEVKVMPKWVPKSKKARMQPVRERFVNMTMPLFS